MSTKKRNKSTRNQAGVIPSKVVTYCRVSTNKQGVMGLGMEAQRRQLAEFVALHGIEVVGAFEEVQTGKGDGLDIRPQFAAAVALAEKEGATVMVAKLDRLSRDWGFLGTLYAKADLFCLDVPDNNKRMIQLKAFIADWEGELISERTTRTMAEAKAKGIKCGAAAWTDQGKARHKEAVNDRHKAEGQARAEAMRDDLSACAGLSLAKAAKELAEKGRMTAKGNAYSPAMVKRLRERLGLVETAAAVA